MAIDVVLASAVAKAQRAESRGERAPGADAFLQEEEQGEADQGHVVVPADPATDFILGHAQMAFGVLERAFDPEALVLHVSEAFPGGVRGSVGQGR